MSSFLRGSKKVLLGIGLAGAGAAAALLLGLNDERKIARAATLLSDYKNDYSSRVDYYTDHLFNGPPVCNSVKWDHNWDHRHPDILKEVLRGSGSFGPNGYPIPQNETDENKLNEKVEKAKVTATRHLILVRHGQYNLSGSTDSERILTQLGRQQAKLTGLRLKELALPYSRIVQSTMSRAQETAGIIKEELPHVPMDSCELLREGAPFPPEPPMGTKFYGAKMKHYYEDGARIEAAFRRYFHRADPSQTQDSYEILVCHANVIRYFVCRALQLPPQAWLRFSLHNCSVTWVRISPSGRVTVIAVGDSGHIPPAKMTTS